MGLLNFFGQQLAGRSNARRCSGRRAFVAAALLWMAAGGALAQTSALHPGGGASEETVKAAYLLKFLNYVGWPKAAFADDDGVYVIGVANDDGMLEELQRQAAGRRINSRPVTVRRVAAGEVPAGLQVLYTGGRNDRVHQAALARQAKGMPVLLVSDAEGALEQGSMINFRLVDERVRFEVALEPVQRAGLELNSRLLSVAIAVIKGTP
jgi:hypothetical protein